MAELFKGIDESFGFQALLVALFLLVHSLKLSNLWLKRIYLTVVGILAAVTLKKALPQS